MRQRMLLVSGAQELRPNLPANIMDFRGFDLSIILNLRGGIPRPIGKSLGRFESSNLSWRNVSVEGMLPASGALELHSARAAAVPSR